MHNYTLHKVLIGNSQLDFWFFSNKTQDELEAAEKELEALGILLIDECTISKELSPELITLLKTTYSDMPSFLHREMEIDWFYEVMVHCLGVVLDNFVTIDVEPILTEELDEQEPLFILAPRL